MNVTHWSLYSVPFLFSRFVAEQFYKSLLSLAILFIVLSLLFPCLFFLPQLCSQPLRYRLVFQARSIVHPHLSNNRKPGGISWRSISIQRRILQSLVRVMIRLFGVAEQPSVSCFRRKQVWAERSRSIIFIPSIRTRKRKRRHGQIPQKEGKPLR